MFPAVFVAGIPAGGQNTDPINAAFLVIESDLPFVCSSTLQRNQDRAVVPGRPLVTEQGEAAFSYVVQGGGYETESVLVNPSSEALEAELRLSGESSSGPVTIKLPPASARVFLLHEIFDISADATVRGVLRIQVPDGRELAGSAWLRSTDYQSMTALPLENPNTDFMFPYVAQAYGYWTGLSITNAGNTMNQTTVQALDADGQFIGEFTIDLAPGEQRVVLLYQWIPATLGLTGGRVEIHSAGPLLAAEIFGRSAFPYIAAVPGK